MDWSTNPIKLARARGNLGPNATEEELKAEYKRIGGLIPGEDTPNVILVRGDFKETAELVVSESDTTMPIVKKEPKKGVVKKLVEKVTKKKNVSKPSVLVAKKKATKTKR